MMWANKNSATAIAAAAILDLGRDDSRACRRNHRTPWRRALDHVGRDRWATERGYFKEVGIKLDPSDLDTTANSIALLSQGQFDVIEGGIPRAISTVWRKTADHDGDGPREHAHRSQSDAASRSQRPDHHVKQLKGKVIATNGTGSVSTYEIGKVLETGGLTINDVDLKVLPFTQYALAFANKAIDAAEVIPPWTSQFVSDKIAEPFLTSTNWSSRRR